MWLILNTRAKDSNAVSHTTTYNMHMHRHTHTYQGDLHTLPGDWRALPTHQTVVLGKNYRKAPGRFPSQERLLIQQNRDLYMFRALSVWFGLRSLLYSDLFASVVLFFLPAQSFTCTCTLASDFNLFYSFFFLFSWFLLAPFFTHPKSRGAAFN